MTANSGVRRLPPADYVIARVQGAETLARNTPINFATEKLLPLCNEAIKALRADPIILSISSPINVIGDIYGQFYDLLTFFQRGGLPPKTHYLFLGDYVDRGHNSVETISYLLALKIKYPQQVYLLRGNHETPEISSMYGFSDECEERYPDCELFKKFTEVFSYLPLAAIVGEHIFCVHGGISQDLESLDKLRSLTRPLEVPEDGLLADLLWADPDGEITGYKISERGTSYTFGPDVVQEFLTKNDFDLLCRGHQCVQNGFEFPFGDDQSTLTVFSAPNYCDELGNTGAMLKIDADLRCSFELIKSPVPPMEEPRPVTGVVPEKPSGTPAQQ
jgi:serine/threonine-protein phosphatase PP1 catalytic subunit